MANTHTPRCTPLALVEQHADLNGDEVRECRKLLHAAMRVQGAEALRPILASSAFTAERLRTLAKFDPKVYCRTLLAASDNAELVLIGWLPGQFSPPHDHGGTSRHGCAVQIVSGDALESRCNIEATGEAVVIAEDRLGAQDTLVSAGNDIHVLGCATEAESALVTLHLYRPRLCCSSMTIYTLPAQYEYRVRSQHQPRRK
jgi:cysteine dioxygenase